MYLDKANMRFKKLRIQNNLIESVEDNHFGEIEFKEIFIWDCENSKPIDQFAFGEQSKNVKRLNAHWNLPNLTSESNTL